MIYKMDSKFKFLSLNVGSRSDLGGLVAILGDHKPDIVFLQEVKISSEEIDCRLEHLGFKSNVNNNAEDSTKPGVAIVWRTSIQITNIFDVVAGRAQIALLDGYALMNIYAPSGSNAKYERNSFFGQEIFRSFDLYPRAAWIVAGDFNSVLSPQDIENGVGFTQKYCPTLADLVKVRNLSDIFRELYPCKFRIYFLQA